MMCGYCSAAKRLLDSKGVAYTEHDASFSPELRQEMIAARQRDARPSRRSSSATFMSAAATIFMRWNVPGKLDGCWPGPN
jgi:hypothetical protein